MNPDIKQTQQVFVGFKLGFYGFYSAKTIELFSYRQAHFNDGDGIKYYWDSWSDEMKELVVAETYNHWYKTECERLSVKQYDILGEMD